VPSKRCDSSAGLPNSFTNIAPATLNRSVIEALSSPLSCIDARVRPCKRRPTSLAGTRNTGSMANANNVTCQDR